MRVFAPNHPKIVKRDDKIATIVASHKNNQVLKRCLEGVKKHVGDDLFVMADGASWSQFERAPFPRVRGYSHGLPRAPYRNLTLALRAAVQRWAGSFDWVLYCEYDVVFRNDNYRSDLLPRASCVGFDHRLEEMNIPLIDSMFGKKLTEYHYLIGACVFHRMTYLERLEEINFFERFLNVTEFLPPITFPGYEGYDLGEHLYPTLASEYGDVVGLTHWMPWANTWDGNKAKYAVRWKPEVEESEIHAGLTSIVHPMKEL